MTPSTGHGKVKGKSKRTAMENRAVSDTKWGREGFDSKGNWLR